MTLACSNERPLFKLLTPDQTGVTFANTITTNDSLNVQNDLYVYNGAGVGVGDIDNDGLPDIFFAGNMVSSRLYLNKGRMRFEDITERAGVGTTRWATGVAMVDINNDGFLDIYVSVSGPGTSKPEQRANLLFVNNGDRTFTEAASQYGIADTGFTTQAAFLDYDGDGCVDLFLLQNSPEDFARGEALRHPTGIRAQTPGSYNQLYRNDCHGKFTNVSTAAGILRDAGYGLGVAIGDVDRDGRPDIYVSNDGNPNDALYVNNGNGTFTNRREWLKHASFAGMGVDVADFNNDGWPDILQVDMMPRALSGRKRMSGFMTYTTQLEARSKGFHQDYSVNSLQLNNGVHADGQVVFSEIAALAGVANTDWSWSALFADFDNDGYKDIFIGNGYPKAVNDLDYQTAMFPVRRGGEAARRTGLEILERLPGYHESNFVFRNAGDLTFTDKTTAWGMQQPSYSYGAAYADLNNDGRLDLVVNNIDAPAFIYENVGPGGASSHYLSIKLVGDSPQRAIGATVTVTAAGKKQFVYASPYRGFMSSMDDRAHFGLGGATRADSVEVFWPDGRHQVVTDVQADRLMTLKQADASDNATKQVRSAAEPWFAPLPAIPYQHRAVSLIDYSVQPLLPYMISRQGPALATGDVDGDGLDDVFVGGGSGVAGQLFIQRKDGGFAASAMRQPWSADSGFEDWGALLFDANGDGRLDLYVASGTYHGAPQSDLLQDRLYVNQGGGRFVRDTNALPVMLTSTAAVRAADFTGDGKPDLFVGGRLTPRSYPSPTRSYLLRNDGGRFTDVTAEVAPELASPFGMVTDAAWIDFDGDGRQDLVIVGEWMSPQFFHNDGGRFTNVTKATRLPPMRGWWYSVAAGDFDGDGRPDLVAGNLGLNSAYNTSERARFGVYAASFTSSPTTDIVLTQRLGSTEYPVSGLVPLGREIYPVGLRFRTYGSFASAPLDRMFTAEDLRRALHYETDTFASVYLRNNGDGTWTSTPLPNLAQIAPIKSILARDVDGDGRLDLVVAGNLYDVEANTPRLDAGNGLWLRGDGRGHFAPVLPTVSGFLAPLDVAALALAKTAKGTAVLVANTGDSLQTFRLTITSLSAASTSAPRRPCSARSEWPEWGNSCASRLDLRQRAGMAGVLSHSRHPRLSDTR